MFVFDESVCMSFFPFAIHACASGWEAARASLHMLDSWMMTYRSTGHFWALGWCYVGGWVGGWDVRVHLQLHVLMLRGGMGFGGMSNALADHVDSYVEVNPQLWQRATQQWGKQIWAVWRHGLCARFEVKTKLPFWETSNFLASRGSETQAGFNARRSAEALVLTSSSPHQIPRRTAKKIKKESPNESHLPNTAQNRKKDQKRITQWNSCDFLRGFHIAKPSAEKGKAVRQEKKGHLSTRPRK